MPPERLQKLLAQSGYGSRRHCETLIRAGRVQLNGQAAHLGEKADPTIDSITLDHEPIAHAEELTYIVLNKPRGVESTVIKKGSGVHLSDLVTSNERIYPVGRLDVDSEGLILLTNDGELTDRLTHPRYGHEKEYRVLIDGYPTDRQLSDWQRGVVLDDGVQTAPASVRYLNKGASGTWLRITMREGRKRQIRRSAAKLGLRVKRLQRVRISTLRIGNLAAGEWRQLSKSEIAALRRASLRPRNIPKSSNHLASYRPTITNTGPTS